MSYQSVFSSSVFIPHSDATRIWSVGKHRLDLLQRMSTNDLRDLQFLQGRATVLTTPLGRIIGRVIVIHLGERALLLAGNRQSERIRRWLARHIFFNDEVQFSDASPDLQVVGIYGAKANNLAEKLAGGASDLPLYYALALHNGWLVKMQPLAGANAFWAVLPPAEASALQAQLLAETASAADEQLSEILRVEAGYPGVEGELSEQYIPLEVGLWQDVSFKKGCYTGQEIIARMESRGKLAKTLVGLQAQEQLVPGASILSEDGARGSVTSAVYSPSFGWIGLGVLRPSAIQFGAQVRIKHDGNIKMATLRELPFV